MAHGIMLFQAVPHMRSTTTGGFTMKRVIEKRTAARIEKRYFDGKISLTKAMKLMKKHSYDRKEIIKAAS
jgi:hypothetical protein